MRGRCGMGASNWFSCIAMQYTVHVPHMGSAIYILVLLRSYLPLYELLLVRAFLPDILSFIYQVGEVLVVQFNIKLSLFSLSLSLSLSLRSCAVPGVLEASSVLPSVRLGHAWLRRCGGMQDIFRHNDIS